MIVVVPILAVLAAILFVAVRASAAAKGGQVGAGEKVQPKNLYDPLIAEVSKREGIDPVLLKAIVAKESYFNPTAINPEKTFRLDGVEYKAGSRDGQAKLRQFIERGGNPKTLGVNPSIGLAQVRVGLAVKFVPGVTALSLFDPRTNLTASARFLKYLFARRITLETIDAYNVGEDLKPRNLPYRDKVKEFYALFRGDFK